MLVCLKNVDHQIFKLSSGSYQHWSPRKKENPEVSVIFLLTLSEPRGLHRKSPNSFSHTHTKNTCMQVYGDVHTHMHTHKDTRTHTHHTVVEIVFVHFLKIKQELLVVLTAFCRDFKNLMCM